jgi:hypothetical protein
MTHGASESPFMALPAELRCYIYNYIGPVLVYKRAFPITDVCCWPVYRMPTALLQLNKLVHEETKDSLVQKPLRKMNNNHPPTIVLGPTFPRFKSLPYLSDLFHRAATSRYAEMNRDPQHERDTEPLVHTLASWYNEGDSPQHAFSGDMSAHFSETQRPTHNLYNFVRRTFERMNNMNTCEVQFRLLIGCCESEQEMPVIERMFHEAIRHKRQIARHLRGRTVNVESDHLITVVYLDPSDTYYSIAPADKDFWKGYGVNLEFDEASAQDQGLFDKALLAPPVQHFWSRPLISSSE